jgi:integrase
MIDLGDVLSGLGRRIGELLALDWTKIDDEAGTIAIHNMSVETGDLWWSSGRHSCKGSGA